MGPRIPQLHSRAYGMRDFTVCDPDGHCLTLGRGEEQLRKVADHGWAPERRAPTCLVNTDLIHRGSCRKQPT